MAINKNPFNLPTTPLELPSKGLLYDESSPLSSGKVELLTPTAKHEDILTNRNYISNGSVIEKFLEAIIADDVDFNSLLTGDQEAIMLSSRILAFGSEYRFMHTDNESSETQEVKLNLGLLQDKEIDPTLFKKGINETNFTLPFSKKKLTFKLATVGDLAKIEAENKSLKKIHKDLSASVTTYFKHVITSVDGNKDSGYIREFVDQMPIMDGKALREYIEYVKPGINTKFDFTKENGEVVEGLDMPITVDFFWPKS